MTNPFKMPQLFQMPQMPTLPVLYEALLGTPAGESLELTEDGKIGNYYQNSNLWNEGTKVNGGQSYESNTPPTQFKDPADDMYNDISGTYFL